MVHPQPGAEKRILDHKDILGGSCPQDHLFANLPDNLLTLLHPCDQILEVIVRGGRDSLRRTEVVAWRAFRQSIRFVLPEQLQANAFGRRWSVFDRSREGLRALGRDDIGNHILPPLGFVDLQRYRPCQLCSRADREVVGMNRSRTSKEILEEQRILGDPLNRLDQHGIEIPGARPGLDRCPTVVEICRVGGIRLQLDKANGGSALSGTVELVQWSQAG